MKKVYFLLVVTVVISILLLIFINASYKKSINNCEKIIVFDSVIIDEQKTVYLFCEDMGIYGLSVCKLGVAEKTEDLLYERNVVLTSSNISSFKLIGYDTLEILMFNDINDIKYINEQHFDKVVVKFGGKNRVDKYEEYYKLDLSNKK